MYEEMFTNLQHLARQLNAMLQQAEKQGSKDIADDCRRQLSQIEKELQRINKMRSYKR